MSRLLKQTAERSETGMRAVYRTTRYGRSSTTFQENQVFEITMSQLLKLKVPL